MNYSWNDRYHVHHRACGIEGDRIRYGAHHHTGMPARETGGQGCLRPVARIAAGDMEEIEGESGPRWGDQREVQGVGRGNARVTAVFRLDCLEMRRLCFLYPLPIL